MKNININISGRIPNYMFGIVRPEYYEECEKAMNYVSEDIETTAEFIEKLYETTLEDGFDNGLEVFKANVDMEMLEENCPLLTEFLKLVEEDDAGHLQFYEIVLDMSWEEVNIIEDDAYITVTVDDEVVVEEQKLEAFLGEIEWVDEDENPEVVAQVVAFWDKYKERFNIEHDEYTAYIGQNGVLLMNEWIEPKRLSAYKVRERNVTVEHDNIVDFDFSFKAEDFEISKISFLQYGNVTDFHRSAAEYVGSFLAYDNEIIRPDMNIHRDKGFTIYYEDDFKSCDFLIEG